MANRLWWQLFLGVMASLLGVMGTTAQPSGTLPPRDAGSTTVSGYVRQGDRAFAAGNFAEAVQAYTQALDLFNANEYALYNRGNAYRRLKDYPKAIADFTRTLQLNPQNTFALLYRGMSLQAISQPEAAIADYTALLKINDQEPLAYLRRAEAHESLKQRDLALADFKQAVELYTKQKEPNRAEKVKSLMRSLK